jgi:hypothetical protein
MPTTAIGSAATTREELSNFCVIASRCSPDIAETLS